MKPILFIDFDGTLCFDKYWRSLDAKTLASLQSFLFVQHEPLVVEWMHGKHTAEEINRLVAKQFTIPYEKLWPLFVQDCKTMHVNAKTLQSISALRKKYWTVLITDNMDSFSRFTAPALQLNARFDLIVNSYGYGMLKTDNKGALFTKIVQHFESPIKESVVIDNSTSTIDTFTALGGKAHLVTPKQSLEYWLNLLA